MWKRKWVTVYFIVDDFKFRGRTCASVNINNDGELIEEYIEDPEDLEDVEFVESLINDYNDEDIPKEDELTDENLVNIVGVFI